MSDRYDLAAAALAESVAGVRALNALLDFAEAREELDEIERSAASTVLDCILLADPGQWRPDSPTLKSQPQNRPMTIKQQRLAIIFQTWADLYAADPDVFYEVLDADGNAVSEYGKQSALYFEELESKLAGLLPLPDQKDPDGKEAA